MTLPRRLPLPVGVRGPDTVASVRRDLLSRMDWMYEQIATEFLRVLRITQIGSVKVTGASASGTATLGTVEADTSYNVVLTPTTQAGSPAAGANRVLTVSKTTSTIVVTVETAPGVGATQTFDYAIVRNLVP